MADITVTTDLEASPAGVWDDISRIETHVEWMHDAVAIRFADDQRQGVGVRFDCDTKIGPFGLTDRMEITEWTEAAVMGVRHTGVVTGEGRFTLEGLDTTRTRFTWRESLRFPWWLGGPIGAFVGSFVMRWVWRRNLNNLAARFDAGS